MNHHTFCLVHEICNLYLLNGRSITIRGITATPRPIPTIILDAARAANKTEGVIGLIGYNSTGTFDPDAILLPSIDLCTVDVAPSEANQHNTLTDCTLRKRQQKFLKVDEETVSRLVNTLKLNHHHIRHQKRFQQSQNDPKPPMDFDPRSMFVNKQVVLTRENLAEMTGNFSNIDR